MFSFICVHNNAIYLFPGFTPPKPGCAKPLGMMDRNVITDAAITASTILNNNYKASNARLNLFPSSGIGGGWAAKSNNFNQYVQVGKLPLKVNS